MYKTWLRPSGGGLHSASVRRNNGCLHMCYQSQLAHSSSHNAPGCKELQICFGVNSHHLQAKKTGTLKTLKITLVWLFILSVLFVTVKMMWIRTETYRQFCAAWCIVIWIVYGSGLIMYVQLWTVLNGCLVRILNIEQICELNSLLNIKTSTTSLSQFQYLL
jgi:hypothetical protein